MQGELNLIEWANWHHLYLQPEHQRCSQRHFVDLERRLVMTVLPQ